MRSALRITGAAAVLFLSYILGGSRLAAVDFVRGDANSDGVVSMADSHRILTFLFRTGEGVHCGDSADVDNDGRLNITDAILILRYVAMGDAPPAEPFPAPGPDDGFEEEIDGRLPCDTYGGGSPLEDPIASLRVLNAVAAGGEDRHVTVRLAISNSTRVAGYYAELDTRGVIADRSLSDADLNDGVFDLSQTFAGGFLSVVSDVESETLKIGFLSSFVGDLAIPPREEHQPVLEIQLCLEPGTQAGDYPLELKAGEFVDFDSGRRIEPDLVSGIVSVLEDISEPECVIEPSDPTIEAFLNVTFELADVSSPPGSEVVVPFIVSTSDHASTHGVILSVDFDEELLQLLGVETVLERPDGEPWRSERTQVENNNNTPGSAGIDEGYFTGSYVYGSYFNEDIRFPMDEEFVALNLRFLVDPEAPVGVTEVRFLDGGQTCFETNEGERFCWGTPNQILSGQQGLPPSLVNSFIFVNGRINIVGEVTTFIRGDANSDRAVDLSDAVTVLNYLFLGIGRLGCRDAADANDDGELNISDPIAILTQLFLGGAFLPPPNETPADDPTPDTLDCRAGTSV